MGSYYKKEIFNEHVQQGVLGWAEKAKKKSGLRECHSAVESMHGDGADAA
jgi:mlo protein